MSSNKRKFEIGGGDIFIIGFLGLGIIILIAIIYTGITVTFFHHEDYPFYWDKDEIVSIEGVIKDIKFTGARYADTLIIMEDGQTILVDDKVCGLIVGRPVRIWFYHLHNGYAWDFYKIEVID